MDRDDLEVLADRIFTDLVDAENLLTQSSNLAGDHLQQTLEQVDAFMHAASTQLRRAFSNFDPQLLFEVPDGTLESQIEWLFTLSEKLDALIGELA
jgi:hypothetical protein